MLRSVAQNILWQPPPSFVIEGQHPFLYLYSQTTFMNTCPAAHTAATPSWFQENWSQARQTNSEDSDIQSLNTPPYGMWDSIPRPEHQSVSPIPWNLDVERKSSWQMPNFFLTCTQGLNGQESQWNFRTPSRGDTNRLTCDKQPLSSPCGLTVSECWSQSLTNIPHVTLHSYGKPTVPDSYYSESFDSSTCRCPPFRCCYEPRS